jgi:hypothetical protein
MKGDELGESRGRGFFETSRGVGGKFAVGRGSRISSDAFQGRRAGDGKSGVSRRKGLWYHQKCLSQRVGV